MEENLELKAVTNETKYLRVDPLDLKELGHADDFQRILAACYLLMRSRVPGEEATQSSSPGTGAAGS